jgi:hypothetical protein
MLEGSRLERDSGFLTMTSTFLLTLHRECALTIFFTVALGYNFCPGAMMNLPLYDEGDVVDNVMENN